MNPGFASPKVFISYSHDSEEHKQRVLELADRLRKGGVDCNIDEYEFAPSEGWPQWMLNQLDWAEFVLVICTEVYNRRFRGHEKPGIGRGVAWEGAIITQQLYDNHSRSNKFIPIVFNAQDREHIPSPIRGYTSYLLEQDYLSLYRHITNQPQNPKPKLGNIISLSPLPPQQSTPNGGEIPAPSVPPLEPERLENLTNQANLLQGSQDKRVIVKKAADRLIRNYKALEIDSIRAFIDFLNLSHEKCDEIICRCEQEAQRKDIKVSVKVIKTLSILANVIGIKEENLQQAIEQELESQQRLDYVLGTRLIELIAESLDLNKEQLKSKYRDIIQERINTDERRGEKKIDKILTKTKHLNLEDKKSVELFFQSKAIKKNDFKKICEELDLDYLAILDPTFLKFLVEKVPSVKTNLYQMIQNKCNNLRVPYINKPMNINDLYVEVNILEKPRRYKWSDISKMPAIFDSDKNMFNRIGWRIKDQYLLGIEVAENHSKLMVLGQPGAGKSTFLRYLAIQCSDNEFQADRVPVFIQFKNLTDLDNRGFLRQYIEQEFYQYELPESNLLEELLKYGRLMILLDGFDEVSETYSQNIKNEIQDFCKAFPQNHFVISCRIAAQEHDYFEDFTYVEIADFNENQIKSFAKNWFMNIDTTNYGGNGEEKANEFIQELNQEYNQQIREIAITPILLGLTCMVFQDNRKFPSDRAKLYKSGIDILLDKWDGSRGIERDKIYKNLNKNDKISILIEVAYNSFVNEKYFFTQEQITSYIADAISKIYSEKLQRDKLLENSADILRAIEVHHGLLVERYFQIYSFSHLTFQEYFTSLAIVNLLENNTFDYVANNLFKKSWREIFLLCANIFGHSDSLLLAAKNHADKFLVPEQKLQIFIKSVYEKSLVISNSYKPVVIRFFYFIIIASKFINIDCDDIIPIIIFFMNFGNPSVDIDIDLELLYDKALVEILHSACQLNSRIKADSELEFSNEYIHNFQNAVYCLDNSFASQISNNINQLIIQLKVNPNSRSDDFVRLVEFWISSGENWTTQLKTTIKQERYINLNWEFNDAQKKLMEQYYNANKLLIDCLYMGGCTVSPEALQKLEDTLLMPIE